MRFDGRVVVVTGAGQGIGRATADRFAREGARVAYVTRTGRKDIATIEADVSDPQQVRRAFAEIERTLGAVDILVNNAGIGEGGRIDGLTAESWDRVMAVNVRSAFLCTQAALPGMRGKGRGAVVNVSSIAGRDRSLVLGSAYTTSKAALIGFTRHAAAELGPMGIRVNCVCPSQTHTPMLEPLLTPEMEQTLKARNPLGRLAEPDEIANVILFLASDDASYMNGAIVDVNGGVR